MKKNTAGLFEASPVSLWEEDFSLVKKRLDQLKAENIGDLRSYLLANPDLVKELAGLVKIVDVNQRTIKLYKAKSKHDFFSGFAKFLRTSQMKLSSIYWFPLPIHALNSMAKKPTAT